MKVIDLYGREITVTDLEKAIEQTEGLRIRITTRPSKVTGNDRRTGGICMKNW